MSCGHRLIQGLAVGDEIQSGVSRPSAIELGLLPTVVGFRLKLSVALRRPVVCLAGY